MMVTDLGSNRMVINRSKVLFQTSRTLANSTLSCNMCSGNAVSDRLWVLYLISARKTKWPSSYTMMNLHCKFACYQFGPTHLGTGHFCPISLVLSVLSAVEESWKSERNHAMKWLQRCGGQRDICRIFRPLKSICTYSSIYVFCFKLIVSLIRIDTESQSNLACTYNVQRGPQCATQITSCNYVQANTVATSISDPKAGPISKYLPSRLFNTCFLKLFHIQCRHS